MEGCPVVFLFEVVSRPHREEKRLRRLLKVRGMAWFRFLMLLSVRADTCDDDNYRWIIELYDNLNTLWRKTFSNQHCFIYVIDSIFKVKHKDSWQSLFSSSMFIICWPLSGFIWRTVQVKCKRKWREKREWNAIEVHRLELNKGRPARTSVHEAARSTNRATGMALNVYK